MLLKNEGWLVWVAGGADGVKVKVKIAVPNAAKVNHETIKGLIFTENPEIKVMPACLTCWTNLMYF